MNELMWRIFASTGDIQSYLLYKELEHRSQQHEQTEEELDTVEMK